MLTKRPPSVDSGLGIITGTASQRLSNAVTSSTSALIDGYGFATPVLMFAVLAPALSSPQFPNQR